MLGRLHGCAMCAGTVSPWKAARWFPTIGPALPVLSVKDARSASWLCDARRSHPLGDGPGLFLTDVLRADLDIEQSRHDVGVAHQSLQSGKTDASANHVTTEGRL